MGSRKKADQAFGRQMFRPHARWGPMRGVRQQVVSPHDIIVKADCQRVEYSDPWQRRGLQSTIALWLSSGIRYAGF